MTYYVSKDSNGNINGLFTNPQPGFAEEVLPETDSEVIAFLAETMDVNNKA